MVDNTIRKNKKSLKKTSLLLISLLVILTTLIVSLDLTYSFTAGPNYRNVTVDTRVNITNAYPEVIEIIINEGNDITLVAGSVANVTIKAVLRDFDGGNTIDNVTAIFYDNFSKNYSGPADNNDYYGPIYCNPIPSEINGYYANFTCEFNVSYFANSGTQWIANVTVHDNNFVPPVNISGYNTSTILSLYALNVTPLIDYGDMAVTDTSSPVQANVTNLGNEYINISVKGYGATEGDGLAFVCQVGTIALSNEKFSLNQTGDFAADYTSLNNNFQNIPGLTLAQQVDDFTPVINSTYWRLYIPPNPFGVCNGSIVFQAES